MILLYTHLQTSKAQNQQTPSRSPSVTGRHGYLHSILAMMKFPEASRKQRSTPVQFDSLQKEASILQNNIVVRVCCCTSRTFMRLKENWGRELLNLISDIIYFPPQVDYVPATSIHRTSCKNVALLTVSLFQHKKIHSLLCVYP